MRKDCGPCVVPLILFLSVFLIIPFTTACADDHGDDFASATTVSIGSVTNGVLDNTGDLDFFKFTVSQSWLDLIYSRNTSALQQVYILKTILPSDSRGIS